ncbi:Fic family protein [Pseudoalteromonas sp. PAR1]|uniref:Fic family protein n=1 Tax=Pseudoalteromonas sp. PAR1 TaxID=2853443 RepID=UPI00248D0C25|nr:Fic family protein [Pseudoalteromonas sp. PAR1]
MKPVGYSYLDKHYKLILPKLGVEVYYDENAETETVTNYGASCRKIIPKTRSYKDCPYEQMIEAIKYQGIRLHFFAAIFKNVDTTELSAFIRDKPNSKYNRVLWFLFEWLTENKLDLPDLKSGNYINLFEEEFYYTLISGTRDKRTRVINNAIGTRAFCPTVRKTSKILELEKTDVYETAWAKMQHVGDALSADIIGRSINYLYSKETKSSTEIEKESPSRQKMQRFLKAIKNAGYFQLTKEKLIDLQNQIVEDKFKATDYRKSEIYVGSVIKHYNFTDEDVHYIGPKAKHVDSMMKGLLDTHDNLMIDNNIPPLIHATVISFGEVYIHPMDDGNGRIHRYLIHDVMKQREPEHNFIIPISASILKNQQKYDKTLDSISKPLMAMLDWELDGDNDNKVIINNDIDYMYRYPDFTEHVCFVYEMMESAISTELIEEICLLITFDSAKKLLNENADIPNVIIDKIISILISNGGSCSRAKRRYVLKYISSELLDELESTTVALVNDIKSRFKIDISKMMNVK